MRYRLYRDWPRKGEAQPVFVGRSTYLGDGKRAAPRSAGCLAAARGVDLFLQGGKANRADHDAVANDVARRAVQAELLGKPEALLQTAADFVAGEIALEPRHVDAHLLGGGHGMGLVGLTAA